MDALAFATNFASLQNLFVTRAPISQPLRTCHARVVKRPSLSSFPCMSTSSFDNDLIDTAATGAHAFSHVSVHSTFYNPGTPELDDGSVGGSWSGAGPTDWARGGDSSGGDEPDWTDDALGAMLKDRNFNIADVPQDIRHAYRSGLITVDNVVNYLTASSNFISRLLMKCSSGLRNRFIADRLFLLKIVIEEGIGICGKLSAEFEQRRERFWAEKEFVFANLVTAILADFALVYLPAPSVRLSFTQKGSGFGTYISNIAAGLPSNIFQTDRPFTLAQRAGGFALKATQLAGVGFLCCFAGIVFTNSIISLREKLDSNYNPQTEKPNPFVLPVLYGIFLGVSSGSRYQLVNGIEGHVFPRLFARTPRLAEEVATFALRYGNTFWGSQQWVIFCRLTNAQRLKAANAE